MHEQRYWFFVIKNQIQSKASNVRNVAFQEIFFTPHIYICITIVLDSTVMIVH